MNLSAVLRSSLLSAGAALLPCCGDGGDGTAQPDVLEVSPTAPSIALGTQLQFVATGLFGDGSVLDLATVTWSSSDDLVASISEVAGLATSVSPGTATITATTGAVSASTVLTVSSASLLSIEVAPAGPAIPQGMTRQLRATGIFSDGSKQDLTTAATWDSSNDLVAAVNDAAGSKGLSTGVAAGSASVSATLGVVSGAIGLEVSDAVLISLDVSPIDPIAAGTQQQLRATGNFSDTSTLDLTTTAAWSSSDAAVSIGNGPATRGLATGASPGFANITASLGAIDGATLVTVTAATLSSLSVAPASPTTGPGRTRRFLVSGTFSDSSVQDLTTQAIWSSSNPGVAAVSNAAGREGLATGVSAGVMIVMASFGGVSDTTDLTVSAATLVSLAVTPADPSIAPGATQPFTATGTFQDGSVQDVTAFVLWSSSDAGVAAVNNASGEEGRAIGLSAGGTTITATLGAVSESTSLTVE